MLLLRRHLGRGSDLKQHARRGETDRVSLESIYQEHLKIGIDQLFPGLPSNLFEVSLEDEGDPYLPEELLKRWGIFNRHRGRIEGFMPGFFPNSEVYSIEGGAILLKIPFKVPSDNGETIDLWAFVDNPVADFYVPGNDSDMSRISGVRGVEGWLKRRYKSTAYPLLLWNPRYIALGYRTDSGKMQVLDLSSYLPKANGLPSGVFFVFPPSQDLERDTSEYYFTEDVFGEEPPAHFVFVNLKSKGTLLDAVTIYTFLHELIHFRMVDFLERRYQHSATGINLLLRSDNIRDAIDEIKTHLLYLEFLGKVRLPLLSSTLRENMLRDLHTYLRAARYLDLDEVRRVLDDLPPAQRRLLLVLGLFVDFSGKANT